MVLVAGKVLQKLGSRCKDKPENHCWHDRGVEVVPFGECVAAIDRWL